MLKIKLDDLMQAVIDIKSTPNLMTLSDNMKNALVSGVQEISTEICIKAFNYYKVNDFEPEEQIIPVMRKVVTVALEKGMI